MIQYTKNIEMKLHYKQIKDKDSKKSKQLTLSAGTFFVKDYESAMIIKIENEEIIVDAKWLKEACEKAIQISKI